MNVLKTIRSSMRRDTAGEGATETPSADVDSPLTESYGQLNERQAVAELVQFNQAELTAIKTFERANRDRGPVLDKLRYLQEPEPMPGYDALDTGAIAEALAGADMATIKAVRGYERKHQNRPTVRHATVSAFDRVSDRPVTSANGSITPTPDYEGPTP